MNTTDKSSNTQVSDIRVKKRRIDPDQKMPRYLLNNEYENLVWDGPFSYPNMVRIRTPTDGSCFFHAIAKAYFEPYINGKLNNKPLNRKEFIQKLRKDLSKKLKSKVNPTDPQSPIYYNILSRGKLGEFSKSVPNYSLENMVKELDSNRPVDNVYNEFISDQLDKDIYILDMLKKDVYITGYDDEILYKNRPSIVILYLPGHYELMGLDETGVVKTLFDPDHNFIKAIRERMVKVQIANQDQIDRSTN